jgi:hypothetical protein
MTRLLNPIVAIQESSGVALTIPAGATVDYEPAEVVLDVADLQWNGETYFANLEDVLEGFFNHLRQRVRSCCVG